MAPQPIPSPQIISLIPASPSPSSPLPQNPQGDGTLAHSTGSKGNDSDNTGHEANSNTGASNPARVPDISIHKVNKSDHKGANAQPTKGKGAKKKASSGIADIRERWIEEFLQARSLSANSQKAYRQDLERFMAWTPLSWSQVSGRKVAQFKAHLIEAQLAPATINRVLSTLKNFYAWMLDSDQLDKDPTKAVHLLPLAEPEAQDLSQLEVAEIYAWVASGKFPERDCALISVLLHGLRAEEVSQLNLGDYDGTRLHIKKAKADSKGYVPLNALARAHLAEYLDWRQEQGEVLGDDAPLFISCSNRSYGQRLSYMGIWKVVNAIAKATKIDLHAHRFRHTFATDLVLKGMDTYHVMTLTRHKSMKSFKRYTKRADQVAAEQAFFGAIGEDAPEASEG